MRGRHLPVVSWGRGVVSGVPTGGWHELSLTSFRTKGRDSVIADGGSIHSLLSSQNRWRSIQIMADYVIASDLSRERCVEIDALQYL